MADDSVKGEVEDVLAEAGIDGTDEDDIAAELEVDEGDVEDAINALVTEGKAERLGCSGARLSTREFASRIAKALKRGGTETTIAEILSGERARRMRVVTS